MNRTDAPVKQSTPFAVNGQREPILPNTPAGDNTASYLDGFPPITMILKSAGGLPPKGQDMNQILYELSALSRWASSGAINAWDAAFSTAIGGYPMGSIALGTDGTTRYLSTTDSNTTNPNAGGAGWFNLTSGYLKTANNLSEITSAGKAAVAATLANLSLDRFVQAGSNHNLRMILDATSWYVYDDNLKKNIPLALNMGGTGATDAPGGRTALGLGNSATKNVGKTTGTVAEGDDSRITGSMQKSNNGSDIVDKSEFMKNIGGREAALRDVGAAQGQIPDMSFFASGPGWFRLPSGHIIQYGIVNIGPASWQAAQLGWSQSVPVSWVYPIPFPNQASVVLPMLFDGGTTSQWVQTFHANLSGKNSASITGHALGSAIPTTTCSYYIFAIGN